MYDLTIIIKESFKFKRNQVFKKLSIEIDKRIIIITRNALGKLKFK